MERPVLEREKKKKNLERERSFLNGNAFLSVPVPTNFGQRTSLVQSIVLQLRLLSKLCVIDFAARAQPLFPTCHLLKHRCHCLSHFLSPSASCRLFLLSLWTSCCCWCLQLGVAPSAPLPLFVWPIESSFLPGVGCTQCRHLPATAASLAPTRGSRHIAQTGP